MSNHVHLLIKTNDVKLGKIMQRVLTGYALYFNRKYNRSGYVFQGRFKSTVCDEENYLLELVRYIHLNPLRANMVKNLKELACYPWSGHRVLLGKKKLAIQDKQEILARFGSRKEYLDFISPGTKENESVDLEGGGLIRSLGGIGRTVFARNQDPRAAYDQRILGYGDFVEDIWEKLKQEGKQHNRMSFEELADKVSRYCKTETKKLVKWKGLKGTGDAKALLVSLATSLLGLTGVTTGNKMNLSASRISRLKYLGEKILKQYTLTPEMILD